MNEQQVADALAGAFDQHCSRPGPSVEPETFAQLRPYVGCGSQIPMLPGRS
jgi:hypothetical protein